MRLPHTTLDVTPICLGTASFGPDADQSACFSILDKFAELGGNLIDTAHCYSFWVPGGLGVPERRIGEWLRRSRGRMLIATKGGHPGGGEAYPRPEHWLSPIAIARDIDDSLDRLGIDVIDLYYLHRDDGETPVEEIVETLVSEVSRGRIRYFGASNWTVDRIEAANRYAQTVGQFGFVASQPQWSLGTPDWNVGPDPANRYATAEDASRYPALDIAVLPYSATSNGYFASGGERAQSYHSPINAGRLARVQQLSQEMGVTPNQIALAWLLNQEFPVVPIIGTFNPEHLADAFGAIGIGLTDRQRKWLYYG